MKTTTIILLALTLATTVLVSSCGNKTSDKTAAAEATVVAEKDSLTTATDTTESTVEAATADNSSIKITGKYVLPQLNGKPLVLRKEIDRHTITILDFWASWCGPCREEMPNVKHLLDTYASKGLGVIGISVDQNKDGWAAAVSDLGLSWPQVNDEKGELSALFNVEFIPYIVVADNEGNILKTNLRGQPLENFIAEKLK